MVQLVLVSNPGWNRCRQCCDAVYSCTHPTGAPNPARGRMVATRCLVSTFVPTGNQSLSVSMEKMCILPAEFAVVHRKEPSRSHRTEYVQRRPWVQHTEHGAPQLVAWHDARNDCREKDAWRDGEHLAARASSCHWFNRMVRTSGRIGRALGRRSSVSVFNATSSPCEYSSRLRAVMWATQATTTCRHERQTTTKTTTATWESALRTRAQDAPYYMQLTRPAR